MNLKVASVVLNNFTHDSRVEKQADSLSLAGFHVTVFGLWKKGLKSHEVKDRYKIERVKLQTISLRGKLGSLLKFIEFSLRVSSRIRYADIIHCHDYHPIVSIAFSQFFYRNDSKIIYDAHELETEKNGLTKLSRIFVSVLEHWISGRVDGFITVGYKIRNHYLRRLGFKHSEVILNCPAKWPKVSKNLFRQKFKISEQSTVALYQGGFMPGRAIENLTKAFQIIDIKNIDFVFMGYPASTEAGRKSFSIILKKAKEFDNFHYHESVDSDNLINFTGSADLGFCLIEDLCLSYKFCLPNKFFEYAMAGIPILVSDLPEMRKLVEEYDCGVVCDSISPDGIVRGLRKLLARDLKKLGKNARKMAEAHSWEVQEKKLLNLYDKVHSVSSK
jgi:glycosyltransferase involved in cell wall biosynthesis